MYSALVINCVWNAFLSSTAIALNVITIQALRKASSFPKTLQTLLLSLAVSDLGASLLVKPLFIVDLVLKTAERITNNYRICTLSLEIGQVLFASASFVGVVALTVDRFLASHLISDTRNLWLTSVLLLQWSQFGCLAHLFPVLNRSRSKARSYL